MNYIAAALMYHCEDFIAYHIFEKVVDSFGVSEIYKEGLPGLLMHSNNFRSIMQTRFPEVSSHLDQAGIDCNLFF